MLHDQSQRVIFFGDSRADWWIVPVLPEFQCVNAGVPGASSGYLARRFQRMVAPLQPAVVVVQMGVNDLTDLSSRSPDRNQRVQTVQVALASVVAAAQSLGAQVILTTIFPLARGPYAGQVVQDAITTINQHLVATAAVPILDTAAVLCGPDGYVHAAYAEDEVHLNAAGYAALNGALIPMLGGNGEPRTRSRDVSW